MRWWCIPPERRPYPGWSYVAMAVGGVVASYGAAMVVDLERDKARRKRWLASTHHRSHPGYASQHGASAVATWWRSRHESERTLLSIVAANAAVFLAWRTPRLKNFMARYFVHSTRSHPITMVTSMFSHISGLHLLVNMLALYSFGRVLHERMGREQFLAFYLCSGLVSSAGSHLVRAYRRDAARSLGASGAVFGVAAGCAHNPDLRVSLIFLPFFSIPISVALPAMMAYDALGLARGWSTFDHAAHLSGAVFGYAAYAVSMRQVWPRRHGFLRSLGYPIK